MLLDGDAFPLFIFLKWKKLVGRRRKRRRKETQFHPIILNHYSFLLHSVSQWAHDIIPLKIKGFKLDLFAFNPVMSGMWSPSWNHTDPVEITFFNLVGFRAIGIIFVFSKFWFLWMIWLVGFKLGRRQNNKLHCNYQNELEIAIWVVIFLQEWY